jgi:peptidoglycan/LPS O-acetylase OafA/YrhL
VFEKYTIGSKLAVQVFFIISGFYVSLIWNEKYSKLPKSYYKFISNRFIRLFPLYWIVLIFTILICVLVILKTNGQVIPKFDSFISTPFNLYSFLALGFSNIFLIGQDLLMFTGINQVDGSIVFTTNFWRWEPNISAFLFVPQAWSLSIEIFYYLIAPLFIKKNKIALVILILSLSLKWFIVGYLKLSNDPWTYRFFPSELSLFILGHFSYQLYKKELFFFARLGKYIFLVLVIFILGFRLIGDLFIFAFPYSIKETLLLIAIVFCIPNLFNIFKENKFDRKLGDLSYPIYMLHMIVILIMPNLNQKLELKTLMVFTLTLILAFLTEKLFLRKIELFRQKRIK